MRGPKYGNTKFGRKLPRTWYNKLIRTGTGVAGGVLGYYASGGSFNGVVPGYNATRSFYNKKFPRARVSYLRSNTQPVRLGSNRGNLTGSNPGNIFRSNPGRSAVVKKRRNFAKNYMYSGLKSHNRKRFY